MLVNFIVRKIVKKMDVVLYRWRAEKLLNERTEKKKSLPFPRTSSYCMSGVPPTVYQMLDPHLSTFWTADPAFLGNPHQFSAGAMFQIVKFRTR